MAGSDARKADKPARVRWLRWGAVCVAVLGLAGAIHAAFFGVKLTFTEDQLQEQITGHLPAALRTKGLPDYVKNVAIQQADLKLKDAINLQMTLSAEVMQTPITTKALIEGRPRFHPDSGKIFFEPDKIDIQDLSMGSEKPASFLANAAKQMAERLRKSQKKKSNNGDDSDRVAADIVEGLGKFAEKNSDLINANAPQIMGEAAKYYLQERPIYSLKDNLRGLIIKSTVKSVAVEDNVLVVTISVTRVTNSVVVYLALALAAIAVLLWVFYRPQDFKRLWS